MSPKMCQSELCSKILQGAGYFYTETPHPGPPALPPLYSLLQPEDFSCLSISMTPTSVLLCVLVLQSVFSSAWSAPTCNNQCCRFVEDFPVRLKRLRQDYSRIRDFYVSKSSHLATNYYDQKWILLIKTLLRPCALTRLQTRSLTCSLFCRKPTMTWTQHCSTRAWRTLSRYVPLQTFPL